MRGSRSGRIGGPAVHQLNMSEHALQRRTIEKMKKLTIKGSMLTGHPEIDAEHEQLATMINNCLEILDGDEDYKEEKIDQVLNELSEALILHFENEEMIMEGLGYDLLDNHRAHHKSTMGDFGTIIALSANHDVPKEWVLHSLVDGFLRDVMVPDFAFKTFLRESGSDG